MTDRNQYSSGLLLQGMTACIWLYVLSTLYLNRQVYFLLSVTSGRIVSLDKKLHYLERKHCPVT